MPVPLGLQQLSPWAAHLCLRVEGFLNRLIPDGLKGRGLVLAVSGGLDSTAMAVIMKLLVPHCQATLTAAHLDHMLRPDSGRDSQFCMTLAQDMGLICRSGSLDVRALAEGWGTGIEDAGRRARYAWLEEVRERSGAFAVVCAHHLDDLAEDQIMRLIRGAGWPALGGMPAWDPRRRILRPLLMTPKAELRRLLEELALPWREDSTNASPAFTRNRVRNDMLPLFIRENPDYLNGAAELWRQARLDEMHWNDEALSVEKRESTFGRGNFLSNESLSSCSQALRLRLYKRAVEALGPGQALSPGLHGLDDAWCNRSTGKRFQFPMGKEARVEHGGVSFHAGPAAPSVDTSRSGG